MKINKTLWLIDDGLFATSPQKQKILNDVLDAIKTVKWPVGTSKFTINTSEPHGNGVKPIKESCMKHLETHGWHLEERMQLASAERPGPVDAVFHDPVFGRFAVEWETGNISSSHRALNKIVIGMMNKVLIGGILILPSGVLYPSLTDRVGNFPELEPYFPVWTHLSLDGALGVIEVEHDETSNSVPFIPKGTDGRALR
jgi:hypothetical protein